MNWTNRPWSLLWGLLLIHLLAHIDRNILLGFSTQITQELGLSNAQYGFLVGAVWVLSFGVMALLAGSLADRFSRTRVIGVGLLAWSACTAASGLASSFEQMVAARFFVASGEAALVPAAVALLAEAFGERRRGTAMGLFFMGIPLGIGLAFLIAGSFGASHGWRSTFFVLGGLGVLIGLPVLMLCDERGGSGQAEAARGLPFGAQMKAVLAQLRARPALWLTLVGFALAHFVFAGLSFTQLWMVRERGFEAGEIARSVGGLQLLFGLLGALAGGVLADRMAQRLRGGHAGFMVLLVLLCGPLMLAGRFAPAGSPWLFIGLCAGFFLPLALYGPANAVIQSLVPVQMRSTITGVAMLLINVFAIAIGNLGVGAISDWLSTAGSSAPLTAALIGTDVLAVASLLFFTLAARRMVAQART